MSYNVLRHPPVPSFSNGFQLDPFNNRFLFIPTMVTELNPFLSKTDWCRFCIYFISLNLNYFKVFEAVGLKL
jgi:hypothetical protein